MPFFFRRIVTVILFAETCGLAAGCGPSSASIPPSGGAEQIQSVPRQSVTTASPGIQPSTADAPPRSAVTAPPVESRSHLSPDKLSRGVLERIDATRMVVAELKQSTAYAPTLVVWLIDRSASCRELVVDFGRLFRAVSMELPSDGSRAEPELLTAVVTFGRDVQFAVDPPVANPIAISNAIDELRLDSTGKEVTFSAIRQALEKYLPYRTQQQRELLFILVTDEAGDDAELVEQILDAPRKAAVPFYVVGVPAPFGRHGALAPEVEAGIDSKPGGDWLVIRQGPESRAAERIRLGDWGGSPAYDLIDSGFGPFALEWLCRATGGRYLALRPETSEFAFDTTVRIQWPTPSGPRFDPAVMRRYTPEYVSATEYQRALAGNKAKQALHDAAMLGELDLIRFPETTFTKADEATMVRVLSQAQQAAARLEPLANRWYELLEHGASDRDKIQEPRWQAGYDLALGRAAAVKVKVDGYNSMLAALKRGKAFQNPGSTAWVLEPADSVEDGGALQKLIDKSRHALTRVVTEHPGTPWAVLAQKELQTPCGWKWIER